MIVVDDADRENEGDFIMAAEKASPEAINFMATHGRGIICMPCEGTRLEELRIPLMVAGKEGSQETAFAVSIDARGSTTTGTSAYDRATTVRAVCDPGTKPEDIQMPGHVFPLRAHDGGVLKRAGHTEAAVDLSRLAGLFPAGVICEIMHPDGTMARLPELRRVEADFDRRAHRAPAQAREAGPPCRRSHPADAIRGVPCACLREPGGWAGPRGHGPGRGW